MSLLVSTMGMASESPSTTRDLSRHKSHNNNIHPFYSGPSSPLPTHLPTVSLTHSSAKTKETTKF